MSAQINRDRHLTLDIAGRGFNSKDMVEDKELATSLENAIALCVLTISKSLLILGDAFCRKFV